MTDPLLIFYVLLFTVAFLYSSVGHGGASGYLALMAIFSFHPEVMKSSAFLLNVFVSGIAFICFYKGGWFRWRLFYPLALTSIPFAYMGAYLDISERLFYIGLALALIIAALNILFRNKTNKDIHVRPPVFLFQLILGALIGLFSGMLGVGGGIILSPLLIFLKWGRLKEVAAVAALFVFFNSASGLIAQFNNGFTFSYHIYAMTALAIIGGTMGSYAGSHKMPVLILRYTLSLVLFIASIKLIIPAS